MVDVTVATRHVPRDFVLTHLKPGVHFGITPGYDVAMLCLVAAARYSIYRQRRTLVRRLRTPGTARTRKRMAP